MESPCQGTGRYYSFQVQSNETTLILILQNGFFDPISGARFFYLVTMSQFPHTRVAHSALSCQQLIYNEIKCLFEPL